MDLKVCLYLESDIVLNVVRDIQLSVCGLPNRAVQHHMVQRQGVLSYSSEGKNILCTIIAVV